MGRVQKKDLKQKTEETGLIRKEAGAKRIMIDGQLEFGQDMQIDEITYEPRQEKQKKHKVYSLHTEEDVELSPEDARLLFAKMQEESDKMAAKSNTDDIDALVDDILDEVN